MNLKILTRSQIGSMTSLTRTGKLDLTNKKPYRTKEMKALARETAVRGADTVFRSAVPVRYHPEFRGGGL